MLHVIHNKLGNKHLKDIERVASLVDLADRQTPSLLAKGESTRHHVVVSFV